jgi:hypothetical protein
VSVEDGDQNEIQWADRGGAASAVSTAEGSAEVDSTSVEDSGCSALIKDIMLDVKMNGARTNQTFL